MRIGIVSETCAPEFTAIALTVHGFTAGLAARGHGIELIRPGRVTCGSATASAQRAAGAYPDFIFADATRRAARALTTPAPA